MAGVAVIVVVAGADVPPLPVHVSEYAVVDWMLVICSEPFAVFAPDQPPDAEQLMAFVEVHVSVLLSPAEIVVGEALSDTTGAGTVPGGGLPPLLELPPQPDRSRAAMPAQYAPRVLGRMTPYTHAGRRPGVGSCLRTAPARNSLTILCGQSRHGNGARAGRALCGATRQHAAMKLLFVCLGNICRSPTAEGVVRAIAAREQPALALEVDSAGTADYHVGEPPDPRSIAAARRRGYDISGLRARRVTAADFSRFDFVLAMDRANLGELERLGAGGRARLGLFMEFTPGLGEEVPDPYYGGAADFERVLDLCEAGARALLRHLGRQE